jgi:hypothetical protein
MAACGGGSGGRVRRRTTHERLHLAVPPAVLRRLLLHGLLVLVATLPIAVGAEEEEPLPPNLLLRADAAETYRAALVSPRAPFVNANTGAFLVVGETLPIEPNPARPFGAFFNFFQNAYIEGHNCGAATFTFANISVAGVNGTVAISMVVAASASATFNSSSDFIAVSATLDNGTPVAVASAVPTPAGTLPLAHGTATPHTAGPVGHAFGGTLTVQNATTLAVTLRFALHGDRKQLAVGALLVEVCDPSGTPACPQRLAQRVGCAAPFDLPGWMWLQMASASRHGAAPAPSRARRPPPPPIASARPAPKVSSCLLIHTSLVRQRGRIPPACRPKMRVVHCMCCDCASLSLSL